jgi:hypothetical protein
MKFQFASSPLPLAYSFLGGLKAFLLAYSEVCFLISLAMRGQKTQLFHELSGYHSTFLSCEEFGKCLKGQKWSHIGFICVSIFTRKLHDLIILASPQLLFLSLWALVSAGFFPIYLQCSSWLCTSTLNSLLNAKSRQMLWEEKQLLQGFLPPEILAP